MGAFLSSCRHFHVVCGEKAGQASYGQAGGVAWGLPVLFLVVRTRAGEATCWIHPGAPWLLVSELCLLCRPHSQDPALLRLSPWHSCSVSRPGEISDIFAQECLRAWRTLRSVDNYLVLKLLIPPSITCLWIYFLWWIDKKDSWDREEVSSARLLLVLLWNLPHFFPLPNFLSMLASSPCVPLRSLNVVSLLWRQGSSPVYKMPGGIWNLSVSKEENA